MYRSNIPTQPRGASTQSRDSYQASTFQPIELSGRRQSKRNPSMQEYGINGRASFKQNRPPSITFNKQQSSNSQQMRSPSLYEVKVPSIKSIMGYKSQNIRNIVESSHELLNKQEKERNQRRDPLRNNETYAYVLNKNSIEQQKKMPTITSTPVNQELTASHQSFDRTDMVNKSIDSFLLEQQIKSLNQRIRNLEQKTQKHFLTKQQFQKTVFVVEQLKANQTQKLHKQNIDIQNNKTAIGRIKDDMTYMVQLKEFNQSLEEIKRQLNKNTSIFKRGSIKIPSSYDNLDNSLDLNLSNNISKRILKMQEDMIDNRRNIDKLFTEVQKSNSSLTKSDTVSSLHPLSFLVELSITKFVSSISDYSNHQLFRSLSSSNNEAVSHHRMSLSSTFSRPSALQLTYYIDSQGFLLDNNKKYLINNKNKLIRLQQSEISILKQQKIFEK